MGKIPINTRVVLKESGARARVAHQPAGGLPKGMVACIIDTFPPGFVYPEIPTDSWPAMPGSVYAYRDEDLLIVTDTSCPHCYGTGMKCKAREKK